MKHLFAIFAVIFLAGLLAGAIYVFNNPDTGVPTPATTSTMVGPEVITIHETDTNVPNVTPPQELDVIMVPEVIDGKDVVQRCQEMEGELTLDMICHRVSY